MAITYIEHYSAAPNKIEDGRSQEPKNFGDNKREGGVKWSKSQNITF